MVRVKVCGITNREDALAAARAGADAIGLVFAPSPRQVTPEEAYAITSGLPPFLTTVGVFVNAPLAEVAGLRYSCRLGAIQLHGDEPPDYALALGGLVIKAFRVGKSTPEGMDDYPAAALLLDTAVPGVRGGSGQSFDWSLAQPAARTRPVILAGGLGPANVAQAIQQVNPYAVDASSSLESTPGRKDHDAITRFVAAARGAADA